MDIARSTSLRRLSPVSDADAAALFGATGCEELLADVTRLPVGRGGRSQPATRRRRLVLAVAVLALAGIATARTWVALGERTGPGDDERGVHEPTGVDTIIPSTSG